MKSEFRPRKIGRRSRENNDAFCDLVLHGGAVDGLVYPWILCDLARCFKFNKLAGTSIGAVAAAIAAAAEYSRRYGSNRGFNEVLYKAPEKLSVELSNGKTRLENLFQPSEEAREIFDFYSCFLREALNSSDGDLGRALWKVLLFRFKKKILLSVLLAISLSVTLGIYLLFAGSAVVGAATAGAVVFVLVLPFLLLAFPLIFLRKAIGVFSGKGNGLCSGKSPAGGPDEKKGITDWIYEGIQGAAGLPADRPLSFRQLWAAPGGVESPHTPDVRGVRRGARSIDLRMTSANLSLGRPFNFPYQDADAPLFFCPEEFRQFFPDAIVDHMIGIAEKAPDDVSFFSEEGGEAFQSLYRLPGADLPIVVGVRLSLGFPFLFKAVPIWVGSLNSERKLQKIERTLLTDGGVCSNHPVSQFDTVLPRWPTFEISLGSTVGPNGEHIWLEKATPSPASNSIRSKSEKEGSLSKIFNFIYSIFLTSKDWRGLVSQRAPGNRERVLHVALGREEGLTMNGLNFAISSKKIMQISSKYSAACSRLLLENISNEAEAEVYRDYWDRHRWIRLISFVAGLKSSLHGFSSSTQGGWNATEVKELADKINCAHAEDGTPLSQRQLQSLLEVVDSLKRLEELLDRGFQLLPTQSSPAPKLAVRFDL